MGEERALKNIGDNIGDLPVLCRNSNEDKSKSHALHLKRSWSEVQQVL